MNSPFRFREFCIPAAIGSWVGVLRGNRRDPGQDVPQAARTAPADSRVSGVHVSIAGRLRTRHDRALCVARRSGRYVKGAQGTACAPWSYWSYRVMAHSFSSLGTAGLVVNRQRSGGKGRSTQRRPRSPRLRQSAALTLPGHSSPSDRNSRAISNGISPASSASPENRSGGAPSAAR
jgi:hypothetical protein